MRLSPWLLAGCLVIVTSSALSADDWPQWLGPKRDSVWRETGILETFPEGGPKVLWRKPVAGGYAGPAVANGKVFVTDYETAADVRSVSDPGKQPDLSGKERVHCFDAKTGDLLWSHSDPVKYGISYPAGPRCTPTVHDGKVYTLGAEGLLLCLTAEKGEVVWQKDFKKDFGAKTPLWGFCGHPLVDGQKLICIVGGSKGVVYALNKDTGAELWHALKANEPGYSAPTMIEAGGVRQLLIWDPDSINSLNPETGDSYWNVPLQPNYSMSIMPPRGTGDVLFAGGIGGKSVLLKLAGDKPAVTEVWRGSMKTGASPVNSVPFLEQGFMYAVDQPGTLLGVDLKDGTHVWETYQPVAGTEKSRKVNSGTAFIVKNGDRFFLTSETGHLIIAKMSPKGYQEISRWKMLEPTGTAFGRDVVWSHPAFANKCVYARNDKDLVCVSLAANGKSPSGQVGAKPAVPAKPTTPQIAPTQANAAYGPHERNVLDFWKAEGEGPRPLVVFIHGGGWTGGDKQQNTDKYKPFLARGISVAAINYRLTGKHPLPAPVHDAARAIQFLRSKAADWNIDKQKIAVTGGSAGACSSLWLLFHDDLADPHATDPVLRESTRVCAAAASDGQTSIDPKVIEGWLGPNVLKHRMINMAVGEPTIEGALKNYEMHRALYFEFSPYNHVDAKDPPLLMTYAQDLEFPSRDAGHGIHHPLYGVKLKEKSDSVGHECHLIIAKVRKDDKYANSQAFLIDKLLQK